MTASQLVERVRRLMTAPRETLPATLAESGEVKALLIPYVLVLAAIGPIVGFLSTGILGVYQPATTIFNTTIPASFVRMPIAAGVAGVLRFGVNVGGWFFLAFISNKLAPSFGGREDPAGARKAAACTATPLWLAGGLTLLNSVPHLDSLVYLGGVAALAYAIVLGMWAVPLHLSVPEPKAVGHVLACVGITLVAAIAAQWLLTLLVIAPFMLR